MASVRVLFVARSMDHISYYQSILEALLERGASLDLVFDREWSRFATSGKAVVEELACEHPALTAGWLSRRNDRLRAFLFALRELRSYRSYLVRRQTTQYYIDRWRKYLTPRLRSLSENALFAGALKAPLADFLMKSIEYAAPPDNGVVNFIRNKAPSVVVICPLNMRFSEEMDYLKAAKKLKIPTALPVYSWDNLSTKGLIQIAPDRVFVWNDFQHKDALEIHNLPRNCIYLAGAPFMDKWFRPHSSPMPRNAFFESIGLDPQRPLLLYLGSSKNVASDESWFVEAMKDHLENSQSERLQETQVLVRPHPANADVYSRISRPDIRVWPERGALPSSAEEFTHMRNTFLHANAAVGINTSAMIDSILAGLPTFSVRLDHYVDTQANTPHFRYLEETDALCCVSSLPHFSEELRTLLDGRDARVKERRDFAQRFARPRGLDRPAGDVIAEAIIGLATSNGCGAP